MEKVLIIVNADAGATGRMAKLSPVTERMVNALKQAIPSSRAIEVIGTASLWSGTEANGALARGAVYCPLTIQLPHWLDFPGRNVFQACRDIEARRAWVASTLHYKTCSGESSFGDLWLPIAVTENGTRYGDPIGEGAMPNSYERPRPLGEKSFRALSSLSERLLEHLSAPPSVYLLQFRLVDREVVFDRLWPFPAAPALASLNGREPDLYAHYWQCLSDRPSLAPLVSGT
jgi:hypothetical protein